MPTPPGAGRVDWLDRLIDLLAAASGALLCALGLLVCVDVATRSSGLYAMPWTLDVAEYSLYLMTFFGAPWVLREGGHIGIDLVVQRLGPVARHRAAVCSHVTGAAVCLLLLYYSCRVWWASYRDGTLVYETFVFSEWILLVPAPPTFLILLLVFLRWLARGAVDTRPGTG